MLTSILELSLEFLDLLLELSEQRILGVLVNLGFVLDVLGAVSIAQCADCLIIVIVCWTAVRHL